MQNPDDSYPMDIFTKINEIPSGWQNAEILCNQGYVSAKLKMAKIIKCLMNMVKVAFGGL